jgi:ATP-dependent Clp protease ATP-binding subunit ClpB
MAELQYGQIPELEKALAQAAQVEQTQGHLLKNRVGQEDIAEVVAKWTGIPVSKMLSGEKEKLLNMEANLAQRVIGQAPAIHAAANAIRRARSGLADPMAPIGSFLFLGPTGVGKTELCKALAGFLFDTEAALIRIDMSEFMEKHAVARLIGAPPGYVGYEAGGYLTEAVRRRPYSIVLIDEIEKAHPDVFNILLQVLDEGRLTDSQGRTIDFKNTVIVMTSNIGATTIQEMSNQGYEVMQKAVISLLGQHFKPEFINRIDEAVVFHALSQADIKAILGIQIKQLQARLQEKELSIELTPAALDKLASWGYDPVYGARPLKRTLRQQLENPLAREILAGHFVAGECIEIHCVDEQLVFTPKA